MNPLSSQTSRDDQAKISRREEQRAQMPLIKILSHITGDGGFALAQQPEVTISHLRGHLVADVQQLPNVRIELGALWIVPQRCHVFG